ncbi:hypothetical protein ACFL2Q_14700 [Thermodesulfobacteriota bacterium]
MSSIRNSAFPVNPKTQLSPDNSANYPSLEDLAGPWHLHLDKIELEIEKISEKQRQNIEKVLHGILKGEKRDGKPRQNPRKGPHKYGRVKILENAREKILIFRERNRRIEPTNKSVCSIVFSCKDKRAYAYHHNILTLVEKELEKLKIRYRINAEIALDTKNERAWQAFKHFLVPKRMKSGDAWYWQDRRVEGFGDDGQYFNKRSQVRHIQCYHKEEEGIFRIELRIRDQYLRRQRIVTISQLIEKMAELIRKSLSLRIYDLEKILRLRETYYKAGTCPRFHKPSKKSYEKLIKEKSSAEIQATLEERLKGHLSSYEIKIRTSREIPLGTVLTIATTTNQLNNHVEVQETSDTFLHGTSKKEVQKVEKIEKIEREIEKEDAKDKELPSTPIDPLDELIKELKQDLGPSSFPHLDYSINPRAG